MTPPKKMSLLEFFNDKSYGGSWADAEIDMASILVPITSLSYSTPSGNNFYGGSGVNTHYGDFDSGPPYIVKLTHLPLTCLDAFIEDLFASRFTPFVKFKIIVDPSSNILETGVVRKIAFVELQSNGDLQKSLKWLDLYYKGNRRVAIELAEFLDFQYCMDFNKNHQEEIATIEREFTKNKFQHRAGDFAGRGATADLHGPPARGGHDGSNFMNPHAHAPFLGRAVGDAPVSSIPQKPKPNPFGAAKPVDILSHQQEIEKRIKQLNATTSITLGTGRNSPELLNPTGRSQPQKAPPKDARRQSISILKRPQTLGEASLVAGKDSQASKNVDRESPKIVMAAKNAIVEPKEADKPEIVELKPATAPPKFVASPNPPSVWTLSGASILKAKPELTSDLGSRKNSPGNKKPATKPVPKPVVLKKKSVLVSPEPWVPLKSVHVTATHSPATPQTNSVSIVSEIEKVEETKEAGESSKERETRRVEMTSKADESNKVEESSKAEDELKNTENGNDEKTINANPNSKLEEERETTFTKVAEPAKVGGPKPAELSEVSDEGAGATRKSGSFESPFSQSEIVSCALDAEEAPGPSLKQATSKSTSKRPDFKTKFNELITRPFVPKEKKTTKPNKANQLRNYTNTITGRTSAQSCADNTNAENSLSQSSDWRADRKSVARSASPPKKERKPFKKISTRANSSEAPTAAERKPAERSASFKERASPSEIPNAAERKSSERRASFKDRAPSSAYHKKVKAKNVVEMREKLAQKLEASPQKTSQDSVADPGSGKEGVSGQTETARKDQQGSIAAKEEPTIDARSNRGGRGSRLYRGGMNRSRRGRGGRQHTHRVEQS